MPTRGISLRRRARSTGGKLLRRLHLLPGGMPDGIGEDEALQDATLDGEVLVYFPDTTDSLYQLRSWYGPLHELHRAQGVTIVCMDSRTAAVLRDEVEMPVVVIALEATLDAIILRSGIKLVLYVNYNALNSAALRSRSAIHVSLLHGDSDKVVSVSNQIKAYDYSFVAGQAAIDRLERYTSLFDAPARCIPVGRPSQDTDRTAIAPRSDPRRTVLYAPTWEGGEASAAYSSLLSHGPTAVRSMLEAGLRVIYRPHPLTGVRVAGFGTGDQELRELLSHDPLGTVSEGRPLQQDFEDADLLLCDVSAVANDWLPTGRPLIITRTGDPLSSDAATALLRTAPRLDVHSAGTAGALAALLIEKDPGRDERLELVEYYLGDITPGSSLERFLEACRRLSSRRDEMWERISRQDLPAAPGSGA